MWANGLHDLCENNLGALCVRRTLNYVCAGDAFSAVGRAVPGWFGGQPESWIKQQLESTGSYANVSVTYQDGRVYIMGVSRIDRAQQRDIISDIITTLRNGNYNVDEGSFVIGIKPASGSVAAAQERAMTAQQNVLRRRAAESALQAPVDALVGSGQTSDGGSGQTGGAVDQIRRAIEHTFGVGSFGLILGLTVALIIAMRK